MSENERLFGRVFGAWMMTPRKSDHGVMAIGHQNEPFLLQSLPDFLHKLSGATISLTALCEVGLVVHYDRPWFGTSPDAVCSILDSFHDRIFSVEGMKSFTRIYHSCVVAVDLVVKVLDFCDTFHVQ